jgi:hypothetical protein
MTGSDLGRASTSSGCSTFDPGMDEVVSLPTHRFLCELLKRCQQGILAIDDAERIVSEHDAVSPKRSERPEARQRRPRRVLSARPRSSAT